MVKATTEKPKTWRKTAMEGLYEHMPSGSYYSRFSLNGKPTFRTLGTKDYAAAKVLQTKAVSEREVARQQGVTINADFATLGQLVKELERRIAENTSDTVTKENQGYAITRLRAHWPRPFDATPIRWVTLDRIITFRQHLLTHAWQRVGEAKQPVAGYRPAVVNKTLGLLRMLLEIAVEKHVIHQNPFTRKAVMQESVYLPAKSRKPQLPSRTDMERVFAEMLVIPEMEGLPGCAPSWLTLRARNCQEHARFIAYSGMRVSEANAVTLEDDLGDVVRVRGPAAKDTAKDFNTKTESSDRKVPVHPLLRGLMETIKARGQMKPGGRFLGVETSLNALARACRRLTMPKLTHHDLRHYFATICIEEGVDIPTVSRWLGHSDGGKMAMETYGHLRQEHSIAAMQKVSFSPRTAPATAALPAPAGHPEPGPISPT